MGQKFLVIRLFSVEGKDVPDRQIAFGPNFHFLVIFSFSLFVKNILNFIQRNGIFILAFFRIEISARVAIRYLFYF